MSGVYSQKYIDISEHRNMMYLNCSHKNDVLFFVLYTGTHGWSQVHLIPILIATLNKKKTV